MSRKIARITNDKKLLLGNEVVEGNTRTSLSEHGKLYTKNILEGNKFSIDDEFIEVGEFIEGYPFVKPVIDDSLVLWLDGSTGNNYEKTNIWKDLSGNGNDGKLMNFDFTEDSGWVDGGLRFDGVDDYVQLPELDLDPDNFTIQVDDKIRAFNGDKVMTENGDEWGRNLIRYKMIRPTSYLDSFQIDNNKIIVTSDKGGYGITRYYTIPVDPNTDYIMNGEFNIIKGEVTAGFRVGFQETEEGAITWQLPFKDTPRIINTGDYNFMVFAFYTGIPVISDEGVQVEIYNWKLEKGSTATPWTPAPEDITETNIINHTTPFVKNNTIHTLRFYNRALTDEEIMQNYQAGQCSPLLAMRGDVIG